LFPVLGRNQKPATSNGSGALWGKIIQSIKNSRTNFIPKD
jgi:hypothetical protein